MKRDGSKTRTGGAFQGSPEQTRLALIRSALALFGQKGFEGASTREIAAGAQANIGSIAYHFGGKEGLREACAQHIVQTITGIAGQVLSQPDGPGKLDASAAEERLSAALETMVNFIVARPEAGDIVQFVLRELSHPTSALNIIYDGVFEPVHRRLCRIWEAATGDPAESERTRIAVFTLIGQVVYFRIGREAVMRRMGWSQIGQRQASAIVEVARDNAAAIIKARKEASE